MFKEEISFQELNEELKNYETTRVEKVLEQVDKILKQKKQEETEKTITTYSLYKDIEDKIKNKDWEKIYSSNTMRTDVLVGIRNLLESKNLIEVEEKTKGNSSITTKAWEIK